MLKTQPVKPVAPLLAQAWGRISPHIGANGLLTGSAFFFMSTTIVNGGNYLFNLILGRLLGPALFADVSIIITLFLFLTFITSGFQQTAARFAAMYSANQDYGRIVVLRRWLNRWSWLIGVGCLIVVGGAAPFWQQFFHITSPWLFVIFAIGLPVYFVQGVDRGLLQGQMRFGLLAAIYQAEMWVRLLLGLLLVLMGWAAHGAVFALTISILTTWAVAAYGLHRLQAQQRVSSTYAEAVPITPTERQAWLTFALSVLLIELSLILLNNSDVLIVKRFFDNTAAGHYAALALVGRMVFFATWSVVMTMFPLVAQKQQRHEPHRHLLWTSLGLVAGVSLLIVATAAVAPGLLIRTLFGDAYLTVTPLLWRYAVATAFFALANVLINYHLALGQRTGTFFALGAGVLQVTLLIRFHATLAQVVMIQVYLMGLLLLCLLVWDRLARRH